MKFPDVCLGCRIPAAPEEGRWPPKWTPSEDRCRNPCYFMQFHEAESGWQIRTVLAAQFAIVFTTSTCTDALNSNPVLALISANCFVAKESWGLLIPLQSPFCLELTSYLLRKGTVKRRKRGERTLRSTSSQMRCWQTQKNRQRRFCTLFLCPTTERPFIRPSQSQSVALFYRCLFFRGHYPVTNFCCRIGSRRCRRLI